MKHRLTTILAALIFMAAGASAQESAPLRYVNALEFRMINKGFHNTTTAFNRLPAALKDSVVTDLWERSLNSSGLGIRFATNSKRIGVKYEPANHFHMNHMADTGVKGVDLYVQEKDGHWHYVNTHRVQKTPLQQSTLLSNFDGEMHEYILYLPLYDSVKWLEIGVDENATISAPQVDSPKTSNGKIVFYGTSILQGGCASRPGMAGTNMIQRDMDIECVNIGISGYGKMYMPMARAMNTIEDIAAFVVDPVPNCTLGQCDTLTYNFVKCLRDAHPDVPIIMVEGPMYPYWHYDSYFKKYLPQKNEAFRKNYDRLKKENPKGLYYVTCEGLTGPDEEGTVDGIHLTDYGFRAYADKLEKVLKKALKRRK